MAKTHTWQYIDRGCPYCNARGTILTPCPTWDNPDRHDRRPCRCSGGVVYSRCKACDGLGKLY